MIITPRNARDYSKIIRAIKYYAHLFQSHSRNKRGSKPIWQKRFYEHTIRNEKDFNACVDYIVNNPIKHGHVTDINDWKYMKIKP